MKCLKALLILLVFATLQVNLSAIKIELQEKILLSEKVLLQTAASLCVTEDDQFLVVDAKAGDIKIYKKGGELAYILGRQGYGPNEFALPLFSQFIEGNFIVLDVGQDKIFFYKGGNKAQFQRVKEFFCIALGDDFYLKEDRLYFSGNKISDDGKYYSFYAVDVNKPDRFIYYLPSYVKFGLNSESEYKTELFKKRDLTTIGIRGVFDIHGDFAYYAWEGGLKIFKINLKTKEIRAFGEKPEYYVKPFSNQKLMEAVFNRRDNYISKERNKMSYIKDIFTTQKHVVLVYTLPGKNDEEPLYIGQFYTFEGKMVGEAPFPDKASTTMYFDGEKNILYTIVFEPTEDLDEQHYVMKYRIHKEIESAQ